MILDIPKVLVQPLVDGESGAIFANRGQHGVQRIHGALEVDDLARKRVDPFGDIRLPTEHFDFDFIDVVLELVDDDAVLIHDLVHDPVENRRRTHLQERRVCLQPIANLA